MQTKSIGNMNLTMTYPLIDSGRTGRFRSFASITKKIGKSNIDQIKIDKARRLGYFRE